MNTGETPSQLSPSVLGTKEYWDNAYAVEIANHSSDPSDQGTIWFEDSGAEEKILDFLKDVDTPSSNSETLNEEDENLRILDLGMGNGHLLFALRDEGWQAELTGVDYSETSVQLAKQIHKSRVNTSEDDKEIELAQWDILRDEPGDWLKQGFDIVVDKGTFDAISLSSETLPSGHRLCEAYSSKVEPLIKPGGILLVTSCNWTETELIKWFDGPSLVYHTAVKYPSFTFGGIKGQTVSSVCFKRVHD